MNSYRDKIIACYRGKNIGGTLGMPYEARSHALTLTFYDPVPEEPAANDDLDLQLVWLRHIQEHGFGITSEQLGQAWIDHIDFHPDEYGVAIGNLKKGIMPPRSGVHNNFFKDSLGAAIRSEIWAALFPGRPRVAAHYAYLDGSVDHGGEGVLIILYLAILESDLMASSDLERSMVLAFEALPPSRLKAVIARVRELFDRALPLEAAYRAVLDEFCSPNCSDAVMNMGFIQLGLLYGRGDFGQSVLIAVNCGYDTDSTASTVGAVFGAWKGTAGIPDRWLAPIGDGIRMSPFIRDLEAPATVEILADEIEELQRRAASERLPERTFPIVLPEVADAPDRILWRVNGELAELDGAVLDLRGRPLNLYADTVLETEVVSPVDQEVRLITCGYGLNKLFFDDRCFGQWGCPCGTPVVPAFHRTLGGVNWRLRLKAGVRHRIKLTLFTTDSEIPVIHYALGGVEREGRHAVEIRWGLGEPTEKKGAARR